MAKTGLNYVLSTDVGLQTIEKSTFIGVALAMVSFLMQHHSSLSYTFSEYMNRAITCMLKTNLLGFTENWQWQG